MNSTTNKPKAQEAIRVYLHSLVGDGSRRQRSALDRLARHLPFPHTRDCGLDVAWHELSVETVATLRKTMMEKFSSNTINTDACAFRQVIEMCADSGDISPERERLLRKAFKNVPGSRLPRRSELSDEELTRLFDACGGRSAIGLRDAAALVLLFFAGLRRTEAISVQTGSCHAEERSIRIVGKRNKERVVPLPAEAWAVLEAWLAARGDRSGPLLLEVNKKGEIQESGITGSALWQRVKLLCKRAGVDDASCHDFRASRATKLMRARIPLALIQEFMGHESATTTLRYSRLYMDEMSNEIDSLGGGGIL